MIQITAQVIGAEAVRAELSSLAARLSRPRALIAECAKHAEVTIRRHFRDRDGEGNRNGWPSRHFFLRQGRDVTSVTEVTDQDATVTVASAQMAHKLAGGTVRPKRGKSLAIPLTAEAYQVWPRNWQGEPLFRPKGASFLATARADRKGVRPQYLLVRSVTHDPDPRVLPDLDAEAQAHVQIALRHLDRELSR